MSFIAETNELIDQMREAFGHEVVDNALKEMADEQFAAHRMEMLQAARMAQANRTPTDRAVGAAGLRPILDIPEFDFHYWGLRLGYECWDDKEFVREYQRDNPSLVPVLEKKTNSIIVPATRWTELPAAS